MSTLEQLRRKIANSKKEASHYALHHNAGPKIDVSEIPTFTDSDTVWHRNINDIVEKQSNKISRYQHEIHKIDGSVHSNTIYPQAPFMIEEMALAPGYQTVEHLTTILSLERKIALLYRDMFTIQSRSYIQYYNNAKYPGSHSIYSLLVLKNERIIDCLKVIKETYTTINIILTLSIRK